MAPPPTVAAGGSSTRATVGSVPQRQQGNQRHRPRRTPSAARQSTARPAGPDLPREVHASLPEVTAAGVCRSGAADRLQFLALHWLPFRRELDWLSRVMVQRKALGWFIESRFPLRGRSLTGLAKRNRLLTEVWYGENRGNVCALYAWFVRAMESTGVTAFDFSAVPFMSRPSTTAKGARD